MIHILLFVGMKLLLYSKEKIGGHEHNDESEAFLLFFDLLKTRILL